MRHSVKSGCHICLPTPFTHFLAVSQCSALKLQTRAAAALQCWRFSCTSNSNTGLSWAGSGKQAFKPHVVPKQRRDLFLRLPFFPVHCQWFWWLPDWQPAVLCVWPTWSRCPTNVTLMPPISLPLSVFVCPSVSASSLPPRLSLVQRLQTPGDTLGKNLMVGMLI